MQIELLGTIASVIILVSFLMKGEMRIRFVNIFGTMIFIIYGIIIGSFSVWFLNSSLLIINSIILIKLLKEKKESEADGKKGRTKRNIQRH